MLFTLQQKEDIFVFVFVYELWASAETAVCAKGFELFVSLTKHVRAYAIKANIEENIKDISLIFC